MADDALLGRALEDAGRLAALRRTGLLDTPPEEAFDRLTRLVCRLLGVPAALVSLVEADRQFFKSAVGLPQPWALRRETGLLHSFCKHVVAGGAPLLVQDAARHPLVSGSLAVPELGVVAYLGMPLVTAEGHALGALCAIDTAPRAWTPGDAAALRELAAVTMSEVTLRRLALEMAERVAEEAAARAAAEARARRREALRRLADGVAHDLAGVMQAVQSGVRLATARLGHDAEAARSLLALVGDVARRGGLLIECLLAFAPRGELRPELVDAAALLAQLGRALANAPDAPLRIQVEADPHLPPVLADPEELTAVLRGLAVAAQGAMPEGGTLTLGAALEEVVAQGVGHPARLGPGRYVRLSVTDTGTGMGGERRTAAGAPPATAGSPGSGEGFGLALARDFAEQAGGGLAREDRAGVGSTVALWLPAAEVARAGEAAGPPGG
jgi:signal transduction histidine kinase